MFPVLMLVIMALHAITSATRTEQALQAVADRAAHAASLCCVNVGPARDTARATVEAHALEGPTRRLDCANDVDGDAGSGGGTRVQFFDVAEAEVTGDTEPVPAGGTVVVRVVCQLRPSAAGGFSSGGAGVERSAIGIATVDPYRHRAQQAGP